MSPINHQGASPGGSPYYELEKSIFFSRLLFISRSVISLAIMSAHVREARDVHYALPYRRAIKFLMHRVTFNARLYGVESMDVSRKWVSSNSARLSLKTPLFFKFYFIYLDRNYF